MIEEAVKVKECPFCAESINYKAKKCKHCGETLDVALRAAEEAKRQANTPNVFMNAGGGGASSASAASSVCGGQSVHQLKNFPHVLHLLATLLSCGLWFPMWLLHYLFRNRNYYR